MELLIICLCTSCHRSTEEDSTEEVGWGIHRKLNADGWLELSDYFVRYKEEYKNKIEKAIYGNIDTFGYKNKMYIVLDGVGGFVNEGCKLPGFSKHRQAGTFNSIRLHKPIDRARAVVGNLGKLKGVYGSVFGHGWNRNVVYTLTLMNHIWGARHALSSGPKIRERHEYYLKRTPQKPHIVDAVDNLKLYMAKYVKKTKHKIAAKIHSTVGKFRDDKEIDLQIPAISKIVLVGFSRGAVTTIKLSKALNGNGLHWWRGGDSIHSGLVNLASITKTGRSIVKKIGARKTVGYKEFALFKEVPVHIFAADPVAGGTAGQESNKTNFTIRENVESIVCPLSMAENRNVFNFTAVNLYNVKGNGLESKILFLPFPGVHGHVGNRLKTKPKGDKGYRDFKRCTATGTIVHHLVRKFLGHHHPEVGAVFARQELNSKSKTYEFKDLNDYEILTLYAEMVLNRAHYYVPENNKDLGKVVHKLKLKHVKFRPFILNTDWYFHTDVVAELDSHIAKPNYVDCPYYFVNEHHRALFKRKFKYMYRVIWTLGRKEGDDDSWEFVMNAWNEECSKHNFSKHQGTAIQMSLLKVYMNYPHLLSGSEGNMIVNGLLDETWNRENNKKKYGGVKHRGIDKWTRRGGHGSYDKNDWKNILG